MKLKTGTFAEAGGHRGSFLLPAEESLTGTFSLIPQVADAVSVPVVPAEYITSCSKSLIAREWRFFRIRYSALVRNLSIVAERASKPALLPLWAGQSAGLSRQSNAKTLLQTLVAEVSAIADSYFVGATNDRN